MKIFAAFIMTFERANILAVTIESLLNQTVIPEKILIIDNSLSDETKLLIERIDNPRIAYHKVGFNAGPAGAARIGLEKLTEEGYQWIYWGDDDDPPTFDDTFEKLFLIINNKSFNKLGMVGAVGQWFNRLTGTIERIPTNIIKENDIVEVDSVAGNQSMIVNAEVIKMGIFPDENLFFGFEELDFCLKIRKAGLKIMVSSELFIRAREKYNRISFTKSIYHKSDLIYLKRQYYSLRNLLIILKREQLYPAYVFNLLKGLGKSLWGFRYGWEYGMKNFLYLVQGIRDSWLVRLGAFKSNENLN